MAKRKRKMKKRLLSIWMALALRLGLLPTMALAAPIESVGYGGSYDAGTYTITANEGYAIDTLAVDGSQITEKQGKSTYTLAAPPEAIVLQNEGPIRNGYGEYAWIKYMLPRGTGRKRPRAKRRSRRQKE